MEEIWNKNMEDNIDLYWINVIYESMMELFNKYSPEFICVGNRSNSLGGKKQKSDVD